MKNCEEDVVLKLENVSLHLQGMEKPILKNINLQMYPGDFLVILGGNGSGKTSLIKLINRNLSLSRGVIEFQKRSIAKYPLKEFSKALVSLAQNVAESLFSEMTVLENCVLWEHRFKPAFSKMNIKKQGGFYADYLSDYHAQLPNRLKTPVQLLSGGEKQALLLALSMVHPPSLLLLDEHTAALDPHQARNMMSLTQDVIQHKKLTTIMTTHNLDHALVFGNKLIALKDGEIVFEAIGERKEKLDREDLLTLCY